MAVGDLWNLGSFTEEMQNLVPDLPSRISGTNMYHSLMSSINNVSTYTGQNIGSVDVAPQFQDAILFKTAIAVLNSKTLEGSDVSDVKLGEFTIKKGGGSSNIGDAITAYQKLYKDELVVLGKAVSYYRTY